MSLPVVNTPSSQPELTEAEAWWIAHHEREIAEYRERLPFAVTDQIEQMIRSHQSKIAGILRAAQARCEAGASLTEAA